MKKTFTILFLFAVLLNTLFSSSAEAIYDPLSLKNNKFGIHILFPEELSEASVLVNSTGGDWGYVTIPIKASDKDLVKWQTFMDNSARFHLIPLIRLATEGDYFNNSSWSKPTEYDVLDFANFLNSLSWPTKNRYVIVYNEQNRDDEWGGAPDASEYANILSYATEIFKEKSSDFFIILGGLDNASINIPGKSLNQYTYMYQMEEAVPGIFSKIDAISSHSYPNPGFSAPPSLASVGVNSFYYQKNIADTLGNKNLPVFITETGWSSDSLSSALQSEYYADSFNNYWNNQDIIAVTPFVFNADQGPFAQFSFIKNGEKTPIYETFRNLPKIKGEPLLSGYIIKTPDSNFSFPTKKFDIKNPVNSVFEKINKDTKTFFKWLLRV